MVDLVLRNTTPAEKRRLPRSYHSYVAFDKKTREKVADIEWTYRPKVAGGSAYRALMIDKTRPSGGQIVSVYSSDLRKLCEIVRHCYTGEGEAPRHWR